jgi:hypothetical protein
MEADFVNGYIERLQSYVHDLTSKNILLETRVVFAEKRIADLQTQLDQAAEQSSDAAPPPTRTK